LTWSDGANNNGSPVIDYRISYDQSQSVYVVIGVGVLAKSFVTPSNVMIGPGKTYKFVVEARNVVGYSVVSAEHSILASTIPNKPLPPVTSPTAAEINLIVDWLPLTDAISEIGSPITYYTIWILQADGVTWT